MRAIQKTRAEAGFDIIEAPQPVPAAGEVLIQVLLASICGTDYHITSWDDWSAARIKPPLIYGHEFCGKITAVGAGVETLKPGDYVSAEMHWFCGHCPQCTLGHYHICENGHIYGIDRNGCFAEFLTIPAQQVIQLPESIPPEYGAFLDSLGNAVHAVSKEDVVGKSVQVIGCGPVGLFAIAAAKAMGASEVYASDVSNYRLNLALQAGATEIFRADQVTVSEEIKTRTQGHGVDVILEMSGSQAALNDAFAGLKQAGTVVLMGIPKAPVTLDLNRDVIFKETKLIGVNGREIFRTWDIMLDLLQSKKLNLDFIITHRMKLSDFAQAIDLIAAGNSGKILLEP